MSINNTNSLSIVKNVSQHRFLNSNLASNLSTTANSNNSSNSSSTTVNQRRLPKSLSNYSSSNISLNTYSNSNNNNSNLFNSNSNNSQPQPQTQSTYLPSMLKNTPTFQTNKKYSADYNQASNTNLLRGFFLIFNSYLMNFWKSKLKIKFFRRL